MTNRPSVPAKSPPYSPKHLLIASVIPSVIASIIASVMRSKCNHPHAISQIQAFGASLTLGKGGQAMSLHNVATCAAHHCNTTQRDKPSTVLNGQSMETRAQQGTGLSSGSMGGDMLGKA